MLEPQSPRVQGLAIEQERRVGGVSAQLAAREFRAMPVGPIAQHRQADMGQVYANLVRAAGLGHRADRGKSAKPLGHAIEGLRRAAFLFVADRGHLLAVFRMYGNRAIDDVAVHLGRAGHDGKIFLLDRARLELDRQPAMGLVVPGHEDRAAGVAVETMHDARPQRSAAAAKAGAEVELQRTDERSRPVSAGRDARPCPAVC